MSTTQTSLEHGTKRSANSNTYAPVKLWLEPAEMRRIQAQKVLERLAARKLDRKLEKEWGL